MRKEVLDKKGVCCLKRPMQRPVRPGSLALEKLTGK